MASTLIETSFGSTNEPTLLLWSRAPQVSTKLLVLCHGFGGNVTKSWRSITTIYSQTHTDIKSPLFGYDLALLGFNRIPSSLDRLGARLIVRVSTLFPNATLSGETRNYNELHLAGHSLGGLGLRYVLNAVFDKHPGKEFRLTSFAPPYSGTFIGATFSTLAGRLAGTPQNILAGLYLAYLWRPILRDLDQASPALQHLRADSDHLATQKEYPPTTLYHASQERVINMPPFKDYRYASDLDHTLDGTHTSINKSQSVHDLDWIA